MPPHSFVALANNRPNILIEKVRGSIIRVNGVKLLRLSFNIGNSSPRATKTKPEVGVTISGKTRIFTAPRILKGFGIQRFRVLVAGIPRASSRVVIGLGSGDPNDAPLARGEVRVDPRNRIREGNEDKNGSLYDLEDSDREYSQFELLAH